MLGFYRLIYAVVRVGKGLEIRFTPVPQNALHVSTGINVVEFLERQHSKPSNVRPWYGVYPDR